MRAGGYYLGGEQSGHLILADHATTGDGLLSALHLMAAVAAAGRPLAELATLVTKFPQVLINVRVSDKAAVAASAAVLAAVARAEAELGGSGRVLLRPSGTEALVRVMVEAGTSEERRSGSPNRSPRSSRASDPGPACSARVASTFRVPEPNPVALLDSTPGVVRVRRAAAGRVATIRPPTGPTVP